MNNAQPDYKDICPITGETLDLTIPVTELPIYQNGTVIGYDTKRFRTLANAVISSYGEIPQSLVIRYGAHPDKAYQKADQNLRIAMERAYSYELNMKDSEHPALHRYKPLITMLQSIDAQNHD